MKRGPLSRQDSPIRATCSLLAAAAIGLGSWAVSAAVSPAAEVAHTFTGRVTSVSGNPFSFGLLGNEPVSGTFTYDTAALPLSPPVGIQELYVQTGTTYSISVNGNIFTPATNDWFLLVSNNVFGHDDWSLGHGGIPAGLGTVAVNSVANSNVGLSIGLLDSTRTAFPGTLATLPNPFPSLDAFDVKTIGVIQDNSGPSRTFQVTFTSFEQAPSGIIPAAPQSVHAAGQFLGLGDLSGGSQYSSATDVSADGRVVTGASNSASGREAFHWTLADGMTGLGDLSGGTFSSRGLAISGDGTTITGWSSGDGREAVRWTQTSGLVGLGDLPGGAAEGFGISTSYLGDVIVGQGATAATATEAYRWAAGSGMVPLGDLPGGAVESHANGVSPDGTSIVGGSISSSGPEAFLWTSGDGLVGLGDLAGGGFDSDARAISYDGSVVVGRGESALGPEAFAWTQATGMTGLGDLAGGAFFSAAWDVSLDGSVIVGESESAAGVEAFIWTASGGMRSLKDYLQTSFGLDLTGWTLTRARGISADGRTIVGEGINPLGFEEAWIATVPEPSTLALAACGAAMLMIAARGRRSVSALVQWTFCHTLRRAPLVIGLLYAKGMQLMILLIGCAVVSLLVPRSVGTLQAAPILWSTGSGGNGHYYESVSTPLVWEDAKVAAGAMQFLGANGHLATVTSPAENSFLVASFSNPQFLGGYQPDGSAEPNGGWAWVTGETWSYTNWAPGEPNNSFGTEKYLEFFAGGPRWNDISGTDTRTFIVEYDVVPEPSTLLLAACGAAGLLLSTLAMPGRRRARVVLAGALLLAAGNATHAATISGGTFVLPPTQVSGTSNSSTFPTFSRFDPALGQLTSVTWSVSRSIDDLTGALANASSYLGEVELRVSSFVSLSGAPVINPALTFPQQIASFPNIGTFTGVADGFNPFVPGPGTIFISLDDSLSWDAEQVLTTNLAGYVGLGTFATQMTHLIGARPYAGQTFGGWPAGEFLSSYINTSTLDWLNSQTATLTYEYQPVPEPSTLALGGFGIALSTVALRRGRCAQRTLSAVDRLIRTTARLATSERTTARHFQ